MINSKIERYNELVERRKDCSCCKDELCNPAEIKGYAKFDKEIGPWSRWQGNLYAEIMVIGQDWGNVELLQGNYFRDDGYEVKWNVTNENLRYLLENGLGEKIDWKLRGMKGKLFFTNAVLCLRKNDTSMQGGANPNWFKNCIGEGFLREQIEIVKPKVVIGLGEKAFNSILKSFGLKSKKLKESVHDKKGTTLLKTLPTKAFAVYHCGARVTNTYRTKEEQLSDWRRIRNALAPVLLHTRLVSHSVAIRLINGWQKGAAADRLILPQVAVIGVSFIKKLDYVVDLLNVNRNQLWDVVLDYMLQFFVCGYEVVTIRGSRHEHMQGVRSICV